MEIAAASNLALNEGPAARKSGVPAEKNAEATPPTATDVKKDRKP